MSVFMGSARETQIASVRVRRGWFGKLVVQVRYKIERPESPLPGRELIYHVCGYPVGEMPTQMISPKP